MNRFRKSTPCARAVRLALAASLLASGAAQAILRDHGEGDPTLNFPLWYRDFNGTPLQICRSTASDGNGAFCFPLTPEAVPPSFAGNIGPEAFYMNLNANVTNGGIDLRYVAALEAAYGTANPVGAARLGQEVLFARTRFVMHVNTTDGSCAGNYRIVHPYGDDEFQDVGEGKRALFSTLDTPIGAINDFEGALRGQLGPFLHWDDGLETPLPHLSSGTERFIGNPAVLHTYTGSSRMEMKKDAAGNDTNIPIYLIDGTLNTGNLTLQFDANGIPINESLFQHQNYVKVFAPLGCDIGGTAAPAGEGINVLKVNTGFLLGQVWTAAIATPTRVTAAEYSRAPDGSTAIDVWASSEPNNTLVASTSSTPGLVLREEFDTLGRRTGSYHGHIQMAPGAVLPGQVTVNNLTSPALIGVTANIVDTVTITNSAFNPATGSLCVTAHSSDRFDKPALTVAAGPLSESLGTPTLAKLADCGLSALPDADDVLFAGDLPNAPPEVTEPPATVTVSSQREGRHTTPLTVVSAGANTPAPLAAADDFMGGNSDTAITFDVRTNDTPSAAAAGATVMIVRQPQPATGSVVVNADNTVTFTPAATITANTTDNFVYALRSGDGVSNQATVALNLTFVSRPPTANPDNFAVLRTNSSGFVAPVLANDTKPAGSAINPQSIQVSAVTRTSGSGAFGTATPQSDGTIKFVPASGAAAGSGFFTYTVANSTGARSAAARVDVVLESAAESLGLVRNRYTVSKNSWDLRFSTNWLGLPLTPTGYCYLTTVNGTGLKTGANPNGLLIGSGPVDATGNVQMQLAGTKAYNQAGFVNGTDIPTLPANATYTIECRTSNWTNGGAILTNSTKVN